jgi:two-component system chemotaxis response regulator CheY
MKKLKMLIVEDEFLSRNLLASLVAEYGTVEMAVDGEEAVRAVKYAYDGGARYDLILLDIMLPLKDGQDALKEIRAYEQSLGLVGSDCSKIIMTTALSDARNVMQAFKCQCEAYIPKPYSKAKIDEQIRALDFGD